MNGWYLYATILFCIWTKNFVHGQAIYNEPTWSVVQGDLLDDLFIQSEHSTDIPLQTHSLLVKKVCNEMILKDSFSTLMPTNFRSSIRDQVPDIENVLVNEYGSQRYKVQEFVLDLYSCSTPLDNSRKYFLTRSYENARLFFVFAYNSGTKEIALEAYVQEDVVPFTNMLNFDTGSLELAYGVHRMNYYLYTRNKYPYKRNEEYLQENPVCRLDQLHKARLCALVLNTPYYRNQKRVYQANAADVEVQCRERVLNLRFAFQRTTEFMYGCSVTHTDDPAKGGTVYVGQSYRNHQVYTFLSVGTQDNEGFDIVLFDNKFENLSFVVDQYAAEMEAIEAQSNQRNVPVKQWSRGTKGRSGGGFVSEQGDASPAAQQSSTDTNDVDIGDAVVLGIVSEGGFGDGGSGGGGDGGGK